ncbi:MAG: GAF domain-containing sensor histidine kinase [Acidimicrobiales bacterium]
MTPPDVPRSVERGVIGELYWHIQDPVVLWTDGRVVAWNPAAEAAFDVTAEAATAEGFDLQQVFGEATGALHELLAVGGAAELVCAGGCELRLHAAVWRLHGSVDAPLVIMLRDLTDDHRRMDGLAQLNAIGRRLLGETSAEVILQLIVEEAKAMLGADFSALMTLRPGSRSDIAHFAYDAPRDQFPDRLPRCVGLLAVPIDTGAPARLDDIRGHPEGVGIPVRHPPIAALLAVPVMGSTGAVGELAVANAPGRRAFDEVDEALLGELAAHAALAISVAAGRAAERAAKEVEVSLGRMALHDLRTPIAIASGSLQVLRSAGDALSDEQRNDLFAALERSLGRIHDLTEGIARARDREGEPSATVTEVVVQTLVQDAFAAVDDLALRREVLLVHDASATGPVPVLLDVPVALHALENLLTNAVKHSPVGQSVTVTARLQDDLLRFDVTDNGPGLSPHDQARAFDGRLGGPSDVDGAGVGLSIVRRLLEASGGGVGVSSQLGHGATFWCTVPVQQPESAPH